MAHLNNSMPRTLKPKAFGRVMENPTPGQLAFMHTSAYEKQQLAAAYMSPQSGSRAHRGHKTQYPQDMMAQTIPQPRYQSQVTTPQGHYNVDIQHTAVTRHHQNQ